MDLRVRNSLAKEEKTNLRAPCSLWSRSPPGAESERSYAAQQDEALLRLHEHEARRRACSRRGVPHDLHGVRRGRARRGRLHHMPQPAVQALGLRALLGIGCCISGGMVAQKAYLFSDDAAPDLRRAREAGVAGGRRGHGRAAAAQGRWWQLDRTMSVLRRRGPRRADRGVRRRRRRWRRRRRRCADDVNEEDSEEDSVEEEDCVEDEPEELEQDMVPEQEDPDGVLPEQISKSRRLVEAVDVLPDGTDGGTTRCAPLLNRVARSLCLAGCRMARTLCSVQALHATSCTVA